MSQKKLRIDSEKVFTGLQYILAFFLWMYIVYRALFFEIIHDEAISYYLVKTNYWKALPGTFNTHWINSIFIKIIVWLPGEDSVWKLRILSVISWLPFAFLIIKLGQRFNNRFVGWLFFSACIFNPFLVLYFSLARGYALACLLLVISLWYAGKLTDQQEIRPKKWLWVLLPAALSVLSNFSLLYFFLGLITVYIGYLIGIGKWKLLTEKPGFILILLSITTIAFAVFSLLFIKFYAKEIEFEGGDSLIGGLFSSQILKAGYRYLPSGFYFLAGIIWFILLLLAIVWSGYKVYRDKTLTLLFVVSGVCGIILILNFFFHLFLHTVYLSERRALFSYCLLIFAVTGLLDQPWFRTDYKKTVLNSMIIVLIAAIFLNAYQNINTRYFTEWPVQSKTKEALNYLSEAGAKNVGLDLWQYSVTKAYYSEAFPGKYRFAFAFTDSLFVYDKTDKAIVYDYLLLSTLPKDSSRKWKTVLSFPVYGTTILKYTGK